MDFCWPVVVLGVWRYLKGSTLFFFKHLFMLWCFDCQIRIMLSFCWHVCVFLSVTDVQLSFASTDCSAKGLFLPLFCFFQHSGSVALSQWFFLWPFRSFCFLNTFSVFHMENDLRVDPPIELLHDGLHFFLLRFSVVRWHFSGFWIRFDL